MGHSVSGVMAKLPLLEQFSFENSLHPPIPLFRELAFLPLRDEDLDSFLPLPLTGEVQGFNNLSDQLQASLSRASLAGPLVYFETEYHGGVGSQGAIVYHNGQSAYGPKVGDIGPINEALSHLGVLVTPPARDEFETVGLQLHRHTEDWLNVNDDADQPYKSPRKILTPPEQMPFSAPAIPTSSCG